MQSGASKTALLVAGYRARASATSGHVSPVYPVCDDPWAGVLAGDEGMTLAARCDGAFAAEHRTDGPRDETVPVQVAAPVEVPAPCDTDRHVEGGRVHLRQEVCARLADVVRVAPGERSRLPVRQFGLIAVGLIG